MNAFRKLTLCLGTIALLHTAAVHAHTVWIEDTTDKKVVVRFGEVNQTIETSPGHLDELIGVTTWSADAEGKAVNHDAKKEKEGYLVINATADRPAFTETAFAVLKRGTNVARKPFFYARWQPEGAGAGKPMTILDVVPTGKKGEAQVFFRGKPLAGAKVALYSPGEDQDLVTDKDGLVKFPADTAGLYVLAVAHHRENQFGYSAGLSYEQTSHNAALSWRQK